VCRAFLAFLDHEFGFSLVLHLGSSVRQRSGTKKELDPQVAETTAKKTHCQDSARWDRCLPPPKAEMEKMLKRRYDALSPDIGSAICIANAEMKVMRSHLVDKTPEEAMMLANKE
jgi:hypothetical protein